VEGRWERVFWVNGGGSAGPGGKSSDVVEIQILGDGVRYLEEIIAPDVVSSRVASIYGNVGPPGGG